jgi:site-specific DNA-methyltransferase (adenine-specific)
MLIPARTDTKYWHEYVMKAEMVFFIKGRLKFGDSENCAPFPSAVVVFTKRPEAMAPPPQMGALAR